MTQTYSDVTTASTDPSHSVRQTDRQTDGATDRPTDTQTYKLRPITLSETDGQTDARTDRSGPSHSLRRAVTPTQQGQHTTALL